MKKLLAASVVALFAMPFAAGAASEKGSSTASPSSESREFDRMDKNKDGTLSRDEVKGTEHEKDFAKLDKNNDGKLSRQEHGAEKAMGATSGTAPSGAAGSGSPRTSGTERK